MHKKPFQIEYEDQEMHLARTPTGIEVYIPTGRPSRPGMRILVNGRYSILTDLSIGVKTIPRSHLIDVDGQRIPDADKILQVEVSSAKDDEYHAMIFSWSK